MPVEDRCTVRGPSRSLPDPHRFRVSTSPASWARSVHLGTANQRVVPERRSHAGEYHALATRDRPKLMPEDEMRFKDARKTSGLTWASARARVGRLKRQNQRMLRRRMHGLRMGVHIFHIERGSTGNGNLTRSAIGYLHTRILQLDLLDGAHRRPDVFSQLTLASSSATPLSIASHWRSSVPAS